MRNIKFSTAWRLFNDKQPMSGVTPETAFMYKVLEVIAKAYKNKLYVIEQYEINKIMSRLERENNLNLKNLLNEIKGI